MKKWMLLLLFLLFIPVVKAEDYVISNYDIFMTVNEDNTYNITEVITADFAIPKHGIYRDIPLRNEVYRTDGSKDITYAKVKNVSVDAPFEISKSDNMYEIKIGSKNYTVTGKKTYNINYTYDLFSGEKQKDYDEFYFNIIGSDWDTTINKVNFTITMPKEFDKSKIGFSSGHLGTVNSSNVEYEVVGNTIKGSTIKPLKIKEALTIRVPLEEGYFKNKFKVEDLSIIISVICLLFALLIWYFYGRDDKVVETVEFYPPDNLNSLELAFYYKGNVSDNDVISLLIYLANKGYVKINEIDEDNYTITKLKDYDGNNELEKIFMEGLFKSGKTTVGSKDLYDHFYVTTNKLKEKVASKSNKNLLFIKENKKKSNLILFLIFITYLFSFIFPISFNGQFVLSLVPLFLMLFYTPFYKVIKETKNTFLTLFIVVHSSIFLIAIMVVIVNMYGYLISNFMVAIICIIVMFILYNLMAKRTKYGTEILGRIKGFKHFLETVEKEQLEKLVLENPQYFYDILPFTYVLDISDKWINKFETMNLQAPQWYYGSTFEFEHFNHFVYHTINDTHSFSGSKSSSSGSFSSSSFSGGSSSGGGFSGGGSGGGGGGSW